MVAETEIDEIGRIFDIFGQILENFWSFWLILGRSGVREGSGRWRRDPAKGSSEPGSGLGGVWDRGWGQILAILGRFGTFLGPCPESEKFGHVSGTSQKGGSMPGDFDQNLAGRTILRSKI